MAASEEYEEGFKHGQEAARLYMTASKAGPASEIEAREPMDASEWGRGFTAGWWAVVEPTE